MALLSEVKQKKSNKVALKPVTGSSAAADDSAQLVGSNPASNAPLSNASSGSRLLERRSLSAGVRRSVGSSNSLVRQKSTGTAASSSIGVNNKKTLSLASSQQTVASSVEIEKMVDSLDGSLHGGKKKVKVAFAPEVDVCEPPGFANVSPKKRKMKKQGSLNGGAVPVPVVKERKPLILKVSASTVVGCDELGKVIEIELQSATGKLMQNGQAGGTAENEKLGVKDTTGVSTRSSVELSQSLKGLFQNMKLRRKEHVSGPVVPLSPTQALSADDEAERLEQDHNSSSTYPVANESQVPSKPKKKELPSQENRAQQQPSVTAKSSALLPAIHKKVHLPGVKANSYHSTVEVQQQNLKKVQVTAVAVGGSHAHVSPVASWKQNVNKPVLRDVFDGSSGKHRDKSYITQVPRNDDFTIDENYEDDHSVNSVHSVPSTHSVPVAEDANNTQRSRADSYDDPCELDDDFEVDTTEPGATSWEGAGSMDQYNWVSAGPYVPSAGDGTIDEEAESNNNNGFSPVNLEASLGALPMDRMKLLSRGSAGGFMTPLSRKGARAFSGHRTPSRGAMLLASPGGAGGVGSGAYTSVAYFEQDGYGLRDNSNSNNNHSSVHSRSSRGSRFSGSSTSGFAMATPSSATARRHLHHNTAETAKPAIAASKVVIVRKMEHARKVDAEVGVEGVIDLDVAAIKPRRRERH